MLFPVFLTEAPTGEGNTFLPLYFLWLLFAKADSQVVALGKRGSFCPGTRPPEEQVPCRHLLYLIWGTCGYFHNRRLCVWKFLLILPSFQLIQPVHFYTEFHLFDYWLLFLSMVSVLVIGAGSGLVWRARPQTFSRHSIAQVPLQTQAGESHHCLSPWCAHTGLCTSVIPFHQGFTKNANPRSHNSTQPFPLMLGNEH